MGLFPSMRSDEGYQRAQSDRQQSGDFSSRAEIGINPELMAKHEASQREFPRIHLTKGEYIIKEVRRHPIGQLSIWATMLLLVIVTLAIIPFYGANMELIASIFDVSTASLPSEASLILPVVALAGLFGFGGLIAVYVYNGNLFYITNESIIQFIQTSIFSTKEQQINLVNINDVSYRQQGILQQVLHYGTIKVATEGDDKNPYVFHFVGNPQVVTRIINDAMEEATGFAVRYRKHKEIIDRDPTLPPAEKF